MKIGILTIGDEVVMGKTVNTNASYLAKVLESNHYIVSNHIAVRDVFEEIHRGLRFLYESADVVITTGGLGPTVDDITKEACASYFNETMILFPEEVDKIRKYFLDLNREMTENNVRQAYFIKDSLIIKNDNGTAPGMIYETNGQVVVNLPGPPKELEPMLMDSVIPYLTSRVKVRVIDRKYRLMNIGESHAETKIKILYEKYSHIKVAPYASVGVVDYMISTQDSNEEATFNACCEDFEHLMSEYIIGDWSKGIHEIIVDLLSQKNYTLSIAESCTGGMVTSSIVDVSGSSKVLMEGVVTYSNEAKMSRLGVKATILERFGAVSEEVAIEMAKGVALTSHTDFGISITGVAGPTGGTPDKPIGLVYTAIYFKGNTWVYRHQFNGDRLKVRQRSTMGILYELFQIIKTL